jgi:hypothetical protein
MEGKERVYHVIDFTDRDVDVDKGLIKVINASPQRSAAKDISTLQIGFWL